MNLKKSIRRILREEGFIPLPIKRRISYDEIEEAFDNALERMGWSMNNPDSIIYKEKGTTLKTFAHFVIDEMVTYIEQDYFNDNNRIYFSDNDEDYKIYHEKIRKPLLRYYGKRIKEKYDEIIPSNDEEIIQESIRRILKEETNFKKRLQSMIKDVDIRGISNMIGGFDNFKRVMNVQSPMDYLNLFNDLDMVQSMEDSDLILYRYKPKENILIYDKPLNKAYVSYDEIFSILRSQFNLNELEINLLVTEWLEKVYNLQGVKIANAVDTWRFFKDRII